MLNKAIRSFSKPEKVIFAILFAGILISTITMVLRISNFFLVEIPVRGGEISEGIVGTTPPRINPIAVSRFTFPGAENDLITLIYSGLMRSTPEGSYIPDLAQSYTISEDGRVYTFTLKNNITWHDGEPITSDDIVFTIQKAQDPLVGSRHQASWDGVVVEAPDKKTVVFTLKEPYSPFIQNTTLGILPKHLWEDVHPEIFGDHVLNNNPIGSGPYKFKSKKINNNDTIDYYELEAFDGFALGEPYIKNIVFKFYSNEQSLIEAYRLGEVTSIHSISPEVAKTFENEGYRVETALLPRIFGAFFNQNEAKVFTRNEVREALDIAVDRNSIIQNALYGYATPIFGPIPPGSIGYVETELEDLTPDERIEKAKSILEDAGWKADSEGILTRTTSDETLRLAFSISTTKEAPELTETADILKRTWERVGAKVEIKTYETRDNLENYAIRPRDYDLLLFGVIVGKDPDPYAFWHSSQRLDPGLNIASYANIAVDAALEKARTTTQLSERIEQYALFQKEIAQDTPAIFLYAPQLVYLTHDDILGGMSLSSVNTPSERFVDIYTWYTKTEKVWKIFAQ
jgi:peptide/nickel transport system substrate-binding protein